MSYIKKFKNISALFFIIMLFSFNTGYADGFKEWQSVGESDFTDAIDNSADGLFRNIASSTTDGSHIYLAYLYYNDSENLNEIKVMKYDGSSWETAGAFISESSLTNVSIAVENDTVYVSYLEDGKPKVMKLLSETDWDDLRITDDDEVTAQSIVLKGGNGSIYAAYLSETAAERIVVKKYDDGNWESIGGDEDFSGLDGIYNTISLLIDHETIYLIETHASIEENSSNVAVWSYHSGSWTQGEAYQLLPDIDPEYRISAVADDGGIALTCWSMANPAPAVYLRYTASGWGEPEIVSEENTYFSKMILDGSTPYIAYSDLENPDGTIFTVKKQNGSAWEDISTDSIPVGIGAVSDFFLLNGVPHVVYISIDSCQASVMRYDLSQAPPDDCVMESVTLDPDGTVSAVLSVNREITADVIYALTGSNGRFLAAYIEKDQIITPDGNDSFTLSYQFSDFTADGPTQAKVMVWDKVENLRPVCNANRSNIIGE